jgi:hypothetical protein
MERIIDRLDKYMQFKGLNDNKISVNCGLSVGLLGKSRKKGADLGKQSIEKILNFYIDINPEWFKHGFGEMLVDAKKIQEPLKVAEPEAQYGGSPKTLMESQAMLISIQEQLVRNNTKLVDTNNKLAEQVIELCSQLSPGAKELIESIRKEVIESIKSELKNFHAREDAGCANVG